MQRRGTGGFTLIELMVTVLVISILLAIATPQFLGARTRAQDGAARANLRAAVAIAGAYAGATNGTWPTATALAGEDSSLTYVGATTASTTSKTVSVRAGTSFKAAVRSDSGTCWKARVMATAPLALVSTTNACSASPLGVVTTFAGSGTSALIDGTGTGAAFARPVDVAVAANGDVYVADSWNASVRKITSTGVVTTIAGVFVAGMPAAIAVDSTANVYVADFSNMVVRKITPAGVVTTVAGSGNPGSGNGTGVAASFNQPLGIAVDNADNVIVADIYNNRIRKISPAGVVTTLAGAGACGRADGPSASATFCLPTDVATDAVGNVYVTDSSYNLVRKISVDGIVSTVAGTGTAGSADGIATAASFNAPLGIASEVDGTLYIADTGSNSIRVITVDGTVTTLAGGGAGGSVNGTGSGASFDSPYSVAIDSSDNIYIADYLNNVIRKIT